MPRHQNRKAGARATPANAGNNAPKEKAHNHSIKKEYVMSERIIELYAGSTAGKVAGYENRASFKWATDHHPIPEQGYRVNGKPAWTREHLVAWRGTIPGPGGVKRF